MPRVSWRVSMFPPKVPGRHDRLRARARRADAHRAQERLDRDLDVLAEMDEVAVGEVEDPQVGIGEVVGQQPEPRQDRGPAPALGVQVEHLDRQRVAGLGAADGDRPGQRIDAVPVEAGDHVRVESGPIWSSLTSRVWTTTRVAALDREYRRVAGVPGEVDLVGREVVRGRHGRAAYAASPASKRSRIVLAALAGSSRRSTTSSSSAANSSSSRQALLQAAAQAEGAQRRGPRCAGCAGGARRACPPRRCSARCASSCSTSASTPSPRDGLGLDDRHAPAALRAPATARRGSRAPSCRSAGGRPC